VFIISPQLDLRKDALHEAAGKIISSVNRHVMPCVIFREILLLSVLPPLLLSAWQHEADAFTVLNLD